MKNIILLLILVTAASATELSDYPYFFVKDGKFNAYYVIADEAHALDVVSATVISTALAQYENVTTEIGTSKLDSEIYDITKYNAIVIAHPCESYAAYMLEGKPEPCDKNIGGSVGYIKVFEHNGKHQLLVTGISPEDRNKAAKFIAQKKLANLNVQTHTIPTYTNSTPSYFVQKIPTNTSQNKTTVKKTEEPKIKTEEKLVQQTKEEDKEKQKEIEEEKTRTVEIGEYDPLEKIPEKKGFFTKLWDWIKGLFG